MKGVLLLFVPLIAVTGAAVSRIAGGSVTTIAQYRFATSMLYAWASSSTFTYKCGGVIINSNSVLSAASCFDGDLPSRWRLRAGSVRPDTSGTVHQVSSIDHPDSYVIATRVDNIAVVRTATTIVFGTNIQPATLASATSVLDVDTELWAIGWGATQNGGSTAARLQHAAVNVIDTTTCTTRYDGFGTVNERMVCVGVPVFGGRGQCSGDEGSALVLKVDSNVNNNVVVGIFSWGRECALNDFPGINTLIAPHREWIINTSNS